MLFFYFSLTYTESPHSLDVLTNPIFQSSWGFGYSFLDLFSTQILRKNKYSMAKTRYNTVVKAILVKEPNRKSTSSFLLYRLFLSALFLSRCACSWERYWQCINGVHFSSPCTWQHKVQPWPFTDYEEQSSALGFPKHILYYKYNLGGWVFFSLLST